MENVNVTEQNEPIMNEPTRTTGFVNCKRLNVRKKPVKDADNIVCVITEGSQVEVDLRRSNETFYRVKGTSDDKPFYGYCMKKFIDVL